MPDHVKSVPVHQSIIVRAGPGAGKTYLIAQRLKFLFEENLRKNSEVICITYTNTGVEEIKDELIPNHFSGLPQNLFLGTIHSFLIKYLLKPYGHLVKDILVSTGHSADGLPDEYNILPPNGYVKRFTTQRMRNLPPHKLISFESIGYDENGDYRCFRPVRNRGQEYPWLPTLSQMRSFKYKVHQEGFMDLFDVLFFSWKILRMFQNIKDCLSSRFASILVDEFQDTTIIQDRILREFLDTGKTSLFLVGDPDQSIFSYTGASPSTFQNYFEEESFRCGICNNIEHPINVNRRSSSNIINFLNIRSTFIGGQEPGPQPWENFDAPIYIFIGAIDENINSQRFQQNVLERFFSLLADYNIDRDSTESFGVLAHQNKVVSILSEIDSGHISTTTSRLENLKTQNRNLYNVIYDVLLALKHKRFGEFNEAFKIIEERITYLLFGVFPSFCKYDDENIGLTRKMCQVVSWSVLNGIPEDENQTLTLWCRNLKGLINNSVIQVGGNSVARKLATLDCRGRAHQITENCNVLEGLSMVFRPTLFEENFRTIHSAKGTQREAIIVYAHDPEEFRDWLFTHDISINEVSRRGYVAFSRAKKLLCICCELVTSEQYNLLQNMDAVIEVFGNRPDEQLHLGI